MHDIGNCKLQSQTWSFMKSSGFLIDMFVGKVVGELEHEKERLY